MCPRICIYIFHRNCGSVSRIIRSLSGQLDDDQMSEMKMTRGKQRRRSLVDGSLKIMTTHIRTAVVSVM
jgi:hypothetical protein